MLGLGSLNIYFFAKKRDISRKNHYNRVDENQKNGVKNMSRQNSIKEFIGLQDVIVNKIEKNEKEIKIYLEMEVKEHECPCCYKKTKKIHDYRIQKITDAPYLLKPVILVLRKRRYVCPHCGKRFYEKNEFLPRYHRMTSRLSAYIIERLRNTRTFTEVAKEVGKSVSTVTRVFDLVSYSKPKLPAVLAIDEFKGNTGQEKYQVILTDPVNHKVLDILPKRTKYELTDYFKKYSKQERLQVKYFVSDMYKPYKELSEIWFKDATTIADKYHWIRQVIWAFENVRKRIQKQFSRDYRIYFKHSRKLLLKHQEQLTDEQKIQVSVMLSVSADLSTAYYLKEQFYKLLKSTSQEEAKKQLSDWIIEAEESEIPEFKPAITAFRNWFKPIINSTVQPISNGFTEGCNNKIKVLKRNAYGYRNFERFRKRILFMFDNAA